MLLYRIVVYVAYLLIEGALFIQVYCDLKKCNFYCALPTFFIHGTHIIDRLESELIDKTTIIYSPHLLYFS